MWITNFHTPLSMASSLVIFQSFISLFTDSSHVKFGLPRPLLILSACFILPLCTYASEGLYCMCPNHLKRCWTNFSSIGATPTVTYVIIPDSILSCVTTHLSQHAHLRYTQPLDMSPFSWPTLFLWWMRSSFKT
uniref:Uncharacterized protein n=1 Tax=Arundo donax TaxID=35708 RepID=A0A0A9GEL4_ARUDO